MNVKPRSWVKRAVLCLILGAATTVAVAWGFALSGPTWVDADYDVTSFLDEESMLLVGVASERQFGAHRIRLQCILDLSRRNRDHQKRAIQNKPRAGRLPAWLNAGWESTNAAGCGFGWPLIAMYYERYGRSASLRAGDSEHEWRMRIPGIGHRSLPLGIRPLKFGGNTLMYAGIFALLWFAAMVKQRISRMRWNQCPQCGYALNHIKGDHCPGCGATANQRKRHRSKDAMA